MNQSMKINNISSSIQDQGSYFIVIQRITVNEQNSNNNQETLDKHTSLYRF